MKHISPFQTCIQYIIYPEISVVESPILSILEEIGITVAVSNYIVDVVRDTFPI